MNLTETKARIRKAGKNVRVVPMPGQGFDGDQQIEIKEDNNWVVVVSGLSKPMAEGIVRESINRTICG